MAVKLSAQLDGTGTQGEDCGVRGTMMALDYASGGKVRPSVRQVRSRMGKPSGPTNPWDWKRALDSYSADFAKVGLRPVRSTLKAGAPIRELRELLFDKKRRVILAIDYGTVARRNPRLWSSTSFRGNHAIFDAFGRDEDGAEVWTFDSLADGRTIGGKRMVKGPNWWPWSLQRAAAGNVKDGGRLIYPNRDKWLGVAVWKSLPLAKPVPPPEVPEPEEPPDAEERLQEALDRLERQHANLGKTVALLRSLTPDSTSTADAKTGVKVTE